MVEQTTAADVQAEAIAKAKLHILQAVEKRELQKIGKLIQSGFPVNEPLMDSGMTLLMHVAATSDGEVTRQVMTELGADATATDVLGRTALHYACRAGNQEAFQALLENESVDSDAITKAGVTPLMNAIESGNI